VNGLPDVADLASWRRGRVLKGSIGFIAAALLLGGCLSSTLKTYGPVELTSKTMTVPPGGGLTGAIKEALTKDGWRLAIYRGPTVTEGTMGPAPRLETFQTFQTRYRLMLIWRQFDVCVFGFDPAYSYDISVIDNDGGVEVLTLTGRDCEGTIVQRLIDALHGKTK
jgi:hypothetical protein